MRQFRTRTLTPYTRIRGFMVPFALPYAQYASSSALVPVSRPTLAFRTNTQVLSAFRELYSHNHIPAAWVQTRGVEMARPCRQCLHGAGPFASYVVVIVDRTLPTKESLARCLFNGDRVKVISRVYWPLQHQKKCVETAPISHSVSIEIGV